MKISVKAQMAYNSDKGVIGFKLLPECKAIAEKFDKYRLKREKFEQKTLIPVIVIELAANDRTLQQNRTLWALIRLIYIAQNGEEPDEDQLKSLYLDILEVYADKVPNKLKPGSSRPVHISESNIHQAAKLIDACIYILAELCDLSYELQADVKNIFDNWVEYLGSLEDDPLDYFDFEKKILLTEEQWRERNTLSAASGRAGTMFDPIVRAHLVSVGASGINEPRNYAPLLTSEHTLQHQIGWTGFVKIYPSLKGRWNRANRLFGKKERG